MISIKIEGAEEALKKLDPKKVLLAADRTVKELARQGKTEASKAVREIYNIKKMDFDKNITVSSNRKDLEATITISASLKGKSGYGIPQTYFGAVETRGATKLWRQKSKALGTKTLKRGGGSGVRVQVLRGGQFTKYPHAFVTQMKSGHVGVFMRSKIQKMASNPKRAALMELAVTSLPSMFQTSTKEGKATLKRVEDRLREQQAKVWRYKLDEVLKK